MVILSSQKVAADLLDRRAGIYSDRPRDIVASDIMTGGPSPRRLYPVQRCLASDAQGRSRRTQQGRHKDFYETQTKEAILLAAGGLADPSQWDKHLRRAAASMVLSVVYDKPTIQSEQDQNV